MSELPPENTTEKELPGIDQEARQKWLEAMPNEEAKRVANWLLANIQYVSPDDFSSALAECVGKTMEALGDKPYVVVLPPDSNLESPKSESWVAGLAKPLTTHASKAVVSERDLPQFLKDHPDTADLVLYDDAAYSGQRIGLAIEAVASSSNLARRLQAPTTHVAVPFMTGFATETLQKTGEHEDVPVEIHAARRIATLAEVVSRSDDPEAIRATIKEHFDIDLDHEGSKGIGLTVFGHKLPDGHSFPAAVAEGRITDNNGKLTTLIRFMPEIVPPYRQS
jgi:hypothetical protein